MLKEECIFCKIIKGEVPSTKVYEDDVVIAIETLEPVADTHLLIIPKEHTDDITEYEEKEQNELLGKIVNAGAKIAKKLNLDSYRLINNCKAEAGQSVFHTHIHLLNDPKLKDVFI